MPRHRGPAPETQDIDPVRALTSHRSEVAHHRPVEAFRQRNRLAEGCHPKRAAQGVFRFFTGTGHAGPQIVQPIRRHRSIQAAFENDGDRFVVPDIGHICGGQRKRNARQHKIESKGAIRIRENLRHPDFVIHAAIGANLLVVVSQGHRKIDPGGSVRTQDPAPHFEAFLQPGPDRQGRSGHQISPQIRDRRAKGQGSRHRCPDRLAQYQQRNAPARLHLHGGGPVSAVQQIGRGIARRRLGHRFIEEDGEDIAKVLHRNRQSQIVFGGDGKTLPGRPAHLEFRVLLQHQHCRRGFGKGAFHRRDPALDCAVAIVIHQQIRPRLHRIVGSTGSRRQIGHVPQQLPRGAVRFNPQDTQTGLPSQSLSKLPLHHAWQGGNQPRPFPSTITHRFHQGAAVRARRAPGCCQGQLSVLRFALKYPARHGSEIPAFPASREIPPPVHQPRDRMIRGGIGIFHRPHQRFPPGAARVRGTDDLVPAGIKITSPLPVQ